MNKNVSTESANFKMAYKNFQWEMKIVYVTPEKAKLIWNYMTWKSNTPIRIDWTWDFINKRDILNIKEIDSFDYKSFSDKVRFWKNITLYSKDEKWYIYEVKVIKTIEEKPPKENIEKIFYEYQDWEICSNIVAKKAMENAVKISKEKSTEIKNMYRNIKK